MEEETKKMKMAVISGASSAIRFKELNPRASETEVIQHVTEKVDEIIENIDEEL